MYLADSIGANTYITIIGPRKTAGFRINTAQAFNGLASVVAPIVASYAFFGGENDSSSGEGSLDSVKWTYVGVGCGKINENSQTKAYFLNVR